MVFDDEIDSLVYTRKISGLVDSYEKNQTSFYFMPVNNQSNKSIVGAFVFRRLELF